MTRFVPVTVLVMMLAANRVASAQATGSTLPDGSTIVFDKLYLHEDRNPSLVEPKTVPDSLWNYFNLAHCQCSKAAPPGFVEGTFGYRLLLQNATMPNSHPLEIWVGSACDNETNRLMTCHQLTDQTVTQISSIQATNGTTREIPIYFAMSPESTATDCSQRAQDATVWAIADGNGDGTRDFFVSKGIATDAQPPTLPTDFRAVGGDGAISISWKPPIDTTDTYVYQALCARADDDSAVKPNNHPSQRYMTAANLCGLDSIPISSTGIPADPSAPPPAPVTSLPEGLKNLDQTFLCGENTSPTATNLRISGLENGTPYKVVLIAADKFQNAVGTFFTSTITPVVSTDLWEDLHDRGSKTDGGLCLLAETYGDDSPLTNALRAFRDDTLGGSGAGRWLTDVYYATLAKLGAYVHGSVALRIVAGVSLAPLVVFALAWHWLTLPGVIGLIAAAWLWRRRRAAASRWVRRLLQARVVHGTAAIAVVALGASRANAGGYQPYWEDSSVTGDENQSLADEPGLVSWHVGIRLGPYVPDIDKQFGGPSPGPYEQMFGSSFHILPMLDVDRILWRGFGQVGVGLSLGYMQKSARAFSVIKNPDGTLMTNYSQRSGDTNNFRLIPTELTATYRFTWLDDEYGIPVVPYARGGLAYYVWWISTPNGFARACTGTMNPGCNQTKALGASLGVTGAIGLAIRAERIDASAATSMRQSGIQHAGLYGELSLAKVDGFGSETKLSVGDRTWFAGVDFEF
jgi:hypothetical protein